MGTRIVGSTARASNSVARRITLETVPGLAERRSCRAHAARISSFHGISGLSACCIAPVPQVASVAALTSSDVAVWVPVKPSSTTSAVARDGCVAAKSAACATAPLTPRRTASLLPRASSTAVMLSAHCSNVGSAPGVTGSEAPVPGWSKKISRPSDVIASTHP